MPSAPDNYRLGDVRKITSEYRDAALATRHALAGEHLNEHAKELVQLGVGDSFYIENQDGKSPL